MSWIAPTLTLIKRIAFGNFLWMIGFSLCVQAFLQNRDGNFSGGIAGFHWWSIFQSATSLNASEFSFFAGAVVFSISSLSHLIALVCNQFSQINLLEKIKEQKHEESIARTQI